MRPKQLAELRRRLPSDAEVAGGPIDAIAVTGITHDSRAVRPADLYAALPGAHVHGADFAGQAARAGAVAAFTDPAGAPSCAAAGLASLVVADPRAGLGPLAAGVYGDPSDALTLVGVTGTNGKTTTAYLVEAALAAAGRRTGLLGTVQTRIGDTALPSVRTTPEATDLQALFAVMVERGVDAVAMEVSSHALALGRVAGSRFDVALFTNLSQDHLDFHGDLASYFAAKRELFTPAYSARAVVNVDDEHGARLARGESLVPTTTCSTRGAAADWRARIVESGPLDSRMSVSGPDGLDLDLIVALPGWFNAENALGALAALVAAGVDPDVAAEGIAGCAAVPGRMERVDGGRPFSAIVDYAHTPEAVRALLAAVRPEPPGRVLVVLGCGGDRDAGKRPLVGRAAAEHADLVVVTDDNPRSESPAAIRAAVLGGARQAPGNAEIVEVGDRAEAIGTAVAAARPGDVVVVAGKGHEQGQERGGVMTPFDDRTVLLDALGVPA